MSPPKMEIPRELIEFMSVTTGEIATIRKWQENRDESQKWLGRLIAGTMIVTFITNALGALFSMVAVVFVVLVNQSHVIAFLGQ